MKAMRACRSRLSPRLTAFVQVPERSSAMASDLRYGTARSKIAFLFVRVGLAGADVPLAICCRRSLSERAVQPELLYTGRAMDGSEAERWGFYNNFVSPKPCWRKRRVWQAPSPMV